MAKKTGFLHREAIHQGGPLHFAGQPGHEFVVIEVVAVAANFAHANIKAGFEKGFSLIGDLHASAIFEQTTPAQELLVV